MSRKIKKNGVMTSVSLDKNKKYKYSPTGDLVESTGTLGDNEISMSGSKSSLRRAADMERNISILATTMLTTDNGSGVDSPAEVKAAAASDATSKANAALVSAKAYADQAEADAESAASSDATTKANNAKSQAISAASSDATTKANNAKSQAISAAASDATTKANAALVSAKAYADQAEADAESAASSDATTKANNAKSQAISAAAADATSKANAARAGAVADVTNGAGAAFNTLKEIQDAMATDSELSSAIASVTSSAASTAAADATTKANAALASAKVYADAQDTNTHRAISNSVTSTSTSVSASSAAVKAAYDRSWPNTTYSVGDGGLSQINFTSTDHTKLNGIESGATADQTSAQLLASLKTVDSNGTAGLNAGTVDGLTLNGTTNNAANKVVRTDANGYANFGWINTASGASTSAPARIYASNDSYLRYMTPASLAPYILNQGSTKNSHTHAYLPTSGGNVSNNITFGSNYGHGVTGLYSATKFQQVYSMGAAYTLDDNGVAPGNFYGIAWTHSNNTNANGRKIAGHHAAYMSSGTTRSAIGDSIWTSGNVTAYSDERVKENLEIIPDALDKVCQLNGYTYDRTDLTPATPEEVPTVYAHNPTDRHVGVIAQEVLKVLPEAVTGGPNSTPGSEDDHYSVAYGNIVALLIEAVKELKAEIDVLKSK